METAGIPEIVDGADPGSVRSAIKKKRSFGDHVITRSEIAISICERKIVQPYQ